ncbi:MAG TPA: LLM class flavin-dependent oxidoreductase [Spongiibacteraceae bacterium]|jgi:luciferase family oxidoreductase group 1|nr:LLM class flavin-dependent oxidoreductase [Spongiibacteraceae bacterium]HUH36749.1 LLM class flavin-dependent oxidoreductase [Spongiibacteraceae bacterium]
MKLSVLDQSFIRDDSTAVVALQETLQVARHCEALGYHRFWVSEHHDTALLAGSSPEVLLAAIGAATRRIRIGSGGIMLPHYSPYKVAENFSVLANLYPGRVDLGVGRAPGADMATAIALATDGRPKFERFPELVEQLTHYLWSANTKPRLSPPPPEAIPVWMLGSSADSAMLAAALGLPYNVALFINPQLDPRLLTLYRQRFQASAHLAKPKTMLALTVLCAETEARARQLEQAMDVNFIRFITQGGSARLVSPDEAQRYVFTPEQAQYVARMASARAVGTPDQVRSQLKALAERFAVDELMVVTNCYHFEERLRSFELLAQVWPLGETSDA